MNNLTWYVSDPLQKNTPNLENPVTRQMLNVCPCPQGTGGLALGGVGGVIYCFLLILPIPSMCKNSFLLFQSNGSLCSLERVLKQRLLPNPLSLTFCLLSRLEEGQR